MKHLFIQGAIGIGKSTFIRSLLLPYLSEVGGFFVQRIYIGKRYQGFSLKALTEQRDYVLNRQVKNLKEAEHVFLYCDEEGRWHQRPEVFAAAAEYLHQLLSADKKLILLDELGGIELDCQPFMEAVLNVLEGDIPVLGVLKSVRNRHILNHHLAVKLENPCCYMQKILEMPGVEVREMTLENEEEEKSRMRMFIKERFCHGEELDTGRN